MKRAMDLCLTLLAAVLLLPLAVIVALAIQLTSVGPTLYWSNRVGRGGRIFQMPKFRTMKVGTPAVATHLLLNPRAVLTPIGSFLRRTSLDEIPQLWSVLVGDMSFVGPRPALFNQEDLISLRRVAGIDVLRPGITGWAQINGRDELSIPVKVELDREYLLNRSLLLDIKIVCQTAARLLGDKTIIH